MYVYSVSLNLQVQMQNTDTPTGSADIHQTYISPREHIVRQHMINLLLPLGNKSALIAGHGHDVEQQQTPYCPLPRRMPLLQLRRHRVLFPAKIPCIHLFSQHGLARSTTQMSLKHAVILAVVAPASNSEPCSGTNHACWQAVYAKVREHIRNTPCICSPHTAEVELSARWSVRGA